MSPAVAAARAALAARGVDVDAIIARSRPINPATCPCHPTHLTHGA